MNKSMMKEEVTKHLTEGIIPFWKALRDDTYGGYYGYMDYDLNVDKTAEKGCILNSRITWFFANAYILLKDETLLDEARHGYEFLRDHCIDKENGGIFWSMTYDGKPLDTTKHTYNQAFCIYALSSYYDASKDEEALKLAKELQVLIESKCTDEIGYLEAFTKDFQPESNEKLSENGVACRKNDEYTASMCLQFFGKFQCFLVFGCIIIGRKSINTERLIISMFCCVKWLSVIGHRPEDSTIFFVNAMITQELITVSCLIQ